MTEKDNKMLNLQEIAEYMGVSKKTVVSWIYSNQLTAFKLDKTFRVTQEDFQAFLTQNTVKAE